KMSGSRRGLGKSTKLTKKDADGLKEGKTKQFAKVYQPAAYEDNDPISSPPQKTYLQLTGLLGNKTLAENAIQQASKFRCTINNNVT
ncbi:unnamed protein product, partial [Nesidiocoris tenuis]